MSYPARRLRRLRGTDSMRDILQETILRVEDLICPVFVKENGSREEIDSMPGMARMSMDSLGSEMDEIEKLGIKAVMIFGIPSIKDPKGSSAFDSNGIAQRAISYIRGSYDKMTIMSDVCLCQYTDTGHCGIVSEGVIKNDASIKVLGKIAASQAAAGADVVSPSAMMDGQVAAIREALDTSDHNDTAIMSHSAKHRSAFYAPFRDAADCAPKFGDRATYQVPYTNAREALAELEEDIKEGVDIIMIKPALSYLDIICKARERFDVPVAAYSVSGEYALVRAAAERGLVDEGALISEILYSIKRAGADVIVTYFAKAAAAMMQHEKR